MKIFHIFNIRFYEKYFLMVDFKINWLFFFFFIAFRYARASFHAAKIVTCKNVLESQMKLKKLIHFIPKKKTQTKGF
jgi:hypothetical protein